LRQNIAYLVFVFYRLQFASMKNPSHTAVAEKLTAYPSSITQCADSLRRGETTSAALVEACLARIADPAGEGARAFTKVYAETARQAARAADVARVSGAVPASPLAGIPISVKDLFDIEGDITRAGSIFFGEATPAECDAPAIARLRAAGAIIIGRTNMTEFAYGAHGTNRHYGTPLNRWRREEARIPGGSTSGGAVSVTDGMALGTIGSDTGGSVRIPAALTGLAGFKPTQARVPLTGAFPLSHTRDSVGPLGATAECCILMDAAMAGEVITLPAAANLRGLSFGVPTNILFDDMALDIERAVERALSAVSAAGGIIREFVFQELQDEQDGSRAANFSGYEAYLLHRERLETELDKFDPWVSKRLLLGKSIKEADYRALVELRAKLMTSANKTTARFDALLAPSVPIVAPTIAELTADEATFYRINSALLRNAAPFNVFNRPAWSLPCQREGEAPTGLMVVGETNGDAKLQRIGLGVEAAIAAYIKR
jgi:aspartyl-tRNA(Asn)/glutamyl-tRNA(Gln) amidotransferase subunit A